MAYTGVLAQQENFVLAVVSNQFDECVESQQNYRKGRDASEVEGLKAHLFLKWLMKWAISYFLFCIVLVLIDSEVNLGALLLGRGNMGQVALTAGQVSHMCVCFTNSHSCFSGLFISVDLPQHFPD